MEFVFGVGVSGDPVGQQQLAGGFDGCSYGGPFGSNLEALAEIVENRLPGLIRNTLLETLVPQNADPVLEEGDEDEHPDTFPGGEDLFLEKGDPSPTVDS